MFVFHVQIAANTVAAEVYTRRVFDWDCLPFPGSNIHSHSTAVLELHKVYSHSARNSSGKWEFRIPMPGVDWMWVRSERISVYAMSRLSWHTAASPPCHCSRCCTRLQCYTVVSVAWIVDDNMSEAMARHQWRRWSKWSNCSPRAAQDHLRNSCKSDEIFWRWRWGGGK